MLADEHRVFEPETIVEIIDEATGEPIDEINRSGMLVVTSLTRTLMPLIRYPVGDLAAWREPPGSKHRKFILQGRSSLGHRLRVGYASLFPDEIAALITEEMGHQQWQLMLEHADNRDRLSLRIAFSGTRQQADRLCGQLLARITLSQNYRLPGSCAFRFTGAARRNLSAIPEQVSCSG